MAINTNKNLSIETLRGVAILLVVVGHVIGSRAEGGMRIEYPSVLRYIYQYIDYIQMPLFTAIAGWVYAIKPINSRTIISSFIKNKVLRLIVPLLLVSSAYYMLQTISGGTNSHNSLSDIWQIYIFPYSVYWYIASLFLIFILIIPLEIFKSISSKNGFLFVLLTFICLVAINKLVVENYSIPNIFSIRGAINQFPYFLLGVAIYRFKSSLINRKINIISSVFTLFAIFSINYRWYLADIYNPYFDLLESILVIFTLILLFNYKT